MIAETVFYNDIDNKTVFWFINNVLIYLSNTKFQTLSVIVLDLFSSLLKLILTL